MYIYIDILYIYTYARPPSSKIYAFVVLGAWGARNTARLKKFINFQPQNSRKAVMERSKNSKILASTARPGADSFKRFGFFWALQYFEGFEVGNVALCGALQCFVRFRPRNTALLKFRELWGWEKFGFWALQCYVTALLMLLSPICLPASCSISSTKYCLSFCWV